ncbi:multidrug transporter MdtD [Klebsiella michiganensis]|nr:multidrug transporter MdtD [Klebsiella michiganensis]
MTDLPSSVRWQLWIVAFGFFMQALDTTIVNTALPSMAQSLGESPLHMHMVIVSYVLTVAVMLPASGWLADRVGVRNIFFSAIVLFTAGSLFCAQAATLDQLILARVLQGVGGAMMVPVGRLTVMKIVPRSQYMAAMTFVTLPGQVGPLLGPALGGMLVEYASWHWIFLINIPVGIVGAIATLCLMPNYTLQTRRFDLFGFVLLAAGMATLTLALDGSKGLGISPLWLAGLVAVGVASILYYLRHARGNRNALFSLKLFNNRTFSLGLGGSFAGRIGQRYAAVYDPGVFTDRPRLHAVPRRSDDDPDGARQHGDEAHRSPGGQPLRLPSGAGGLDYRPRAGQPAVHGRRPRGLVLAAAGGAIYAGDDQRQPLFLYEYADPERPARRSGQQRQQPAVDGHAAVDEYWRDRRRHAAGSLRPAAYQRRCGDHATRFFSIPT